MRQFIHIYITGHNFSFQFVAHHDVAGIGQFDGSNGSVVTDYQYEQNIYSDSQFLKDNLAKMEKQDETIVIVTDGAFSGSENHSIAKEKNVELITTSLTGRSTADIMADFEFNEDGTKVLHCPAGHAPKSCSYMKINRKSIMKAD